MTKWTQQMPIDIVVGSITALTAEEIEQISQYIERGTILDCIIKDASGEVMVPVGFKAPEEGAPTITVIKNGSIVSAGVEATIVKLGLIMPSDTVGANGDSKSAFMGALYSDGTVKLLVDKTTTTNAIIGTTTKSGGKWGNPSFVISPSPAEATTKFARGTFAGIVEVSALEILKAEETVGASKTTINGYDSPVALKTGDTTPVSGNLTTAGIVIMNYEA